MRLTLRPKILLFTVLPLATLTFVALWVVNRATSTQVRGSIDDGLRRASANLESMLSARAEYLGVAGEVIVQDPRFFSSLTLPGSHRDPEFRATVAGVAREFNSITRADLFEVLDAHGALIASVGAERSDDAARHPLVSAALAERQRAAILPGAARHYQAVATPILAGGRAVGVLLLGQHIGRELADQLRDLTRSEVTFLAGSTVTGSTLEDDADRAAVRRAFDRLGRTGGPAEGGVVELRGRTHRYVTLLRRLPDSEPGDLQYYAVQRALDVESAFLREIQGRLVELGLLALLVALAAGFVVSERITSPVRRLVRGAEEIERGNYDYPIRVQSGDEIGYLATRFDEMREHQRAYVASLKEVARVKSEFINVASHELRTPASIIKGFQELLAQGMLGPLTPQQGQAVEAIGRSVGTLVRIAEDATRVAQVEASQLALRISEHEVTALLRRAADAARAGARGRSVRVTVAAENDPGTARVDGDRLVEAITNLISNGIRYTPDGGEVVVRSRCDATQLLIEVEDTGIGIAEERRTQIFDRPFMIRDSKHHHSSSTLEFKSSGLGLGLPIARGIVRMHGGTIEVESAVGRGSVFRIRLPLEAEAGREAA
ncbi:MAG TPA: ATP-binding protein [Candidatus Eisenbacteria bacterium]|jgi:signal transduction histidine kinase